MIPQFVGTDAIQANGTALTAGVTLQISIDGGAFGAPTNTPAHLGGGYWQVELAAAERLFGQVTVQVTHASGVLPASRTFVNVPQAQDIRDAMKLAPKAGTPATGSIDDHLDSLDNDKLTTARAAKLDNLNADVASRSSHSAADVWAVPARTVTGGNLDNVTMCGQVAVVFGLAAESINANTFAADAISAAAFSQGAADKVWGATARTVTGGTIDTCTSNTDMRGTDDASTHTAGDVWGVATRTVTGGAIDTCASNADMRGTDNASIHTPTDVWNAGTRTVTGGAIDSCATNADMRGTDGAVTSLAGVAQETSVQAVLTQTTRVDGLIEDSAGDRFTAKALEQAPSGGGGLTEQQVRDAMKLSPSAGAPASGSIDDLIASRSSHSAADVWAVSARTVTNAELAQLDAAVSSRSSHSAADVWAVPARTVTNAELAQLDAAVSSRSSHAAADVWAVPARLVTNPELARLDVTVGSRQPEGPVTLAAGQAEAIAAVRGAVVLETDGAGGNVTVDDSLRLQNASAAGPTAGAGSTQFKLRNLANTADRASVPTDAAGNRGTPVLGGA